MHVYENNILRPHGSYNIRINILFRLDDIFYFEAIV